MENLVTFKTAQLAKSKGFNEPCYFLFDGFSNKLSKQNTAFSNKDIHIIGCEIIARPTQSLLQQWLRTVNIDCLPMLNLRNEYSCHIYKNKISINKDSNICGGDAIIPNGTDYNLVLEEGLYESLKLI
jgi:hypothetical protein